MSLTMQRYQEKRRPKPDISGALSPDGVTDIDLTDRYTVTSKKLVFVDVARGNRLVAVARP